MNAVAGDPPWLEYQRRRFMRQDAWRYLKPGTPGYEPPPGVGYQEPAYVKKARERRALEEAKAVAAHAEADARAFRNEVAAIRFELLLIKTALEARRRWRAKAGFNPDQPRVPAGNSDGGRWTAEGGGINDPRILSDAAPDNAVTPGAQFAQNRARGSVRVRLGGQTVDVEGGQAARLVEAQL